MMNSQRGKKKPKVKTCFARILKHQAMCRAFALNLHPVAFERRGELDAALAGVQQKSRTLCNSCHQRERRAARHVATAHERADRTPIVRHDPNPDLAAAGAATATAAPPLLAYCSCSRHVAAAAAAAVQRETRRQKLRQVRDGVDRRRTSWLT
jgi:hypothetical protein